ncbi:MAG: hypothetical protein LBQ12_13820, partial [Deltaproteobacteria bacterium]|nr:hypothetical protein [Deltaproteobacteria bacterium]
MAPIKLRPFGGKAGRRARTAGSLESLTGTGSSVRKGGGRREEGRREDGRRDEGGRKGGWEETGKQARHPGRKETG